jgi:hypothetical protein
MFIHISKIKKVSPFRQLIRARTVWRYSKSRIIDSIKWINLRTPLSNHYYDLDDFNLVEICFFLSQNLNQPYETISNYLKEILNEERMDPLVRSNLPSNVHFGFGRRVVWYVAIRVLKPKTVVETGVHQGMGTYVICRALEMNEIDGYIGLALGTEINSNCGQLIPDRLRKYSRILLGDSLETLRNLSSNIDIFINDSNHDAGYEFEEYKVIEKLLSENSLILGDNSHATHSLRKFCHQTGRRFYFLPETPKNHWYLGAGVGFAGSSNLERKI